MIELFESGGRHGGCKVTQPQAILVHHADADIGRSSSQVVDPDIAPELLGVDHIRQHDLMSSQVDVNPFIVGTGPLGREDAGRCHDSNSIQRLNIDRTEAVGQTNSPIQVVKEEIAVSWNGLIQQRRLKLAGNVADSQVDAAIVGTGIDDDQTRRELFCGS